MNDGNKQNEFDENPPNTTDAPNNQDQQHPDYDHLWKDVITELFEEFLLFFAPDLYELVDFQTPPQSLEQELRTLFPESESNKRVSDKLVKLQLITGKEQWVFVHVEVQGGYEKNFSKRMYQYFYRILDKFDQKVYALALFTDKKASYHPNEFQYSFFGTEATYRYNTYHIAQQSECQLLESNNPFALAVLAGLYLSKSKKNDDLKSKYKLKLMRLLLQGKIENNNIKREYIRKLLVFIDHIMRLPEDFEKTLALELKPLIDKEEKSMGLSWEDTSFVKYYRELAREEGIAKGKEKGLAEGRAEGLEKGLAEGRAEGLEKGLAEGRAEGLEKGLAEGRAEGLEKGLAEGRAEGLENGRSEGIVLGEKQKAIEIATKLLKKGFAVEEVSEDTGLTIEEVKSISENIK